MKHWLSVLLCGLLLPVLAVAAEYHVATDGSDLFGDGSSGSPWKTISRGLAELQAGDTLIIGPGEYAGTANFINSRLYRIPAGSRGRYTVIRAARPFSVRITNRQPLRYHDNMLYLDGDHIHVDGIVFDMVDSPYPEYNADITGSYNKITRCLFRRAGDVNEYGGWLAVTGNYNLIEDSAGVGAARYGFVMGGPDSTSHRNIFRRCVGRVDYSNSNQPKATFAVYGNNQTLDVRDALFQNCLVVDGQAGPSSSEPTYGAWYFPKNAANITLQGSMVLNTEVGYAGYFIKEQQGENIRMANCVAWNLSGNPYVAGIRGNGPGSPLVLEHVTVGRCPLALYLDSSGETRLLDSLFYANGAFNGSDYGISLEKNNHVAGGREAASAGPLQVDGIKVSPFLREPALPGATVMFRYGRSGTLWGEPGYDELTREPLWPWAWEHVLRREFARRNDPPTGNVPQRNDTGRGFCSAAPGGPQSLTEYLFGIFGETVPPAYLAAPAAPEFLAATLEQD